MQKQTAALPRPDDASYEHSKQVADHICAKIKGAARKCIPFDAFMHEALYAPGLGYYVSGNTKFGAAGDFITAPLVSSLFGQTLAQQFVELQDEITNASILELGAGTGKLATDILQTLAKQKTLPKAYLILEVSAELKQRQKSLIETLCPELLSIVQWIKALPDVFEGLIVANEVLDAMPCKRFQIQAGQAKEYYVGIDDTQNEFVWCLQNADTDVKKAIEALEICARENYSSEINFYHSGFIRSLNDCLKQGLILLIDYGYPSAEYYHPERNQGTLKCFFRHHQHNNPLILTGIQDITAHVNFTAIAQVASECELEIEGYLTQGAYLLNLGIEKAVHCIDNEVDFINAVQKMKTLTLPNEMGELFKVMALSRNLTTYFKGFENFNRLHTL